MPLPHYDEVHIISDLHMGGKPGFQILRETERLAAFIRWVGDQCPDGQVALVLNGDVIDTLAEEGASCFYIAVDNAEAIVQRIMEDTSFARVWAALAEFVGRAGRTLVITLGNHDLEMSFPVVQRAVVERLAGDDLTRRARIEFSTMGSGYSCRVNNARLFCTHGNEVDAWNFVRYEELARASRRLNCGRTLKQSEWEPNAGTKMVKEIMNNVKSRYAWIDLLKPEMQAAVGVLVALDPSQLKRFDDLIPVVGEKAKGSLQVDQRLSAEGFTAPSGQQGRAATVDSLLGPNFKEGLRQSTGATPSADELMMMAEHGHQAFNPEADIQADETLGTWRYLWDRVTGWATGVSRAEALRRALKDWLDGDHTFDSRDHDDTCKGVLDSVGSDIDFIVTGHTHLERAIDLGGGRFYFNCGTWIRLLRITKAMLQDEAAFQPVFEVLNRGTMEAIDAFPGGGLVLDQCSAVRIKSVDGKAIGELAHIHYDAAADAINREIIPTRRPNP